VDKRGGKEVGQMAKKINPKDQTRELNRARFEFLKRNKEKFEEFLKYFFKDDLENGTIKPSTDMAKVLQDYCESKKYPLEEFEEILQDSLGRPAVMSFFDASMEAVYRAFKRCCQILKISPERKEQLVWEGWKAISSLEHFDAFFLEELLKDSEKIIKALMSDMPSKLFLVSIDPTRPVDSILAEVKELVKTEKRELPNSRLSWLPIADNILAVWDLWDEAGQPARQAFKNIAKKLNVPESTVKARW